MIGAESTLEVNRGVGESLEANTETIETPESFTVCLRGYNVPAHVHCHLEGELTEIAHLERPNYYIEPGEEIAVPVTVADDVEDPVEGTLEVSTGYGSETTLIDVTIVPGSPGVAVDDSLAKPQRPEPEPSPFEEIPTIGGIEPATLGVVTLGVIAFVIGIATAGSIGGPVAAAGLIAVTSGLAVAAWLLYG